jgi:hypothetical protein
MRKRLASLSLDLDDRWSYLKIHGDPSWRSFPSYLEIAVPRILAFLAQRNLKITVFVVGQDAAQPHNAGVLRSIADAGHELGNHSFSHEPWIAQASFQEADREIAAAHEAIAAATGREPAGFRGPGFASSPALQAVLSSRGYAYDASRLPTFIGPVARWYYMRSSSLSAQERHERRALFGAWTDGLAPNDARVARTQRGPIVDIPVTTMPFTRLPIHCSYLLYLDGYSPAIARRYFDAALALCAATRTTPSLLLHPLDFLGADDVPDLGFFPAMNRPGEVKTERTGEFVDALARRFAVVPMLEHAATVSAA